MAEQKDLTQVVSKDSYDKLITEISEIKKLLKEVLENQSKIMGNQGVLDVHIGENLSAIQDVQQICQGLENLTLTTAENSAITGRARILTLYVHILKILF